MGNINVENTKETLSDIYQEFSHRLFSYGLQICLDRSLVEDALQETFLDLHRHKPAFDKAADKRSYLFASLRYKILHLMKEKHGLYHIEHLEAAQEDTAEDIVIDKERVLLQTSMVKEMFTELSPRQREVLFLRFSEKMSFQEIADYMSIERQSAQNLFGRAVARLRKVFLEEAIEKNQ